MFYVFISVMILLFIIFIVTSVKSSKRFKINSDRFIHNEMDKQEKLEFMNSISQEKLDKLQEVRYSENKMTETEKKEWKEYLKEKEARQAEELRIQEAKMEAARQKREAITRARTISKVMIVGGASDSRKKVGSSIARGAVGGALLGPVGLVGGALSGKNKVTSTTTFLIEYQDGHRETKTVNNDDPEFERLCKYLNM